MVEKTVVYSREDDVGLIKLNRPHVLNAVNGAMVEDLITALEEARDDKKAKVIILKGEGRAFCAGVDIKEGVTKTENIEEFRKYVLHMQDIGRAFIALDKPIIAQIQGYALGNGCEFAMNCDLRIAAEGTRIGFREAAVGATVTTAGTKILPQLVGLGRAKEMLFTAEPVDAETAEKWGLVNKVVPLEQLEQVTMELAGKVAANHPLSLKLARAALDFGLDASFEKVFEHEAQAACISYASGERKIGMKEVNKYKGGQT